MHGVSLLTVRPDPYAFIKAGAAQSGSYSVGAERAIAQQTTWTSEGLATQSAARWRTRRSRQARNRAPHTPEERELAKAASEQLRAALGACGRIAPGLAVRAVARRRLVGFAQRVMAFDDDVAAMGLRVACSKLLNELLPSATAEHIAHAPEDGPLLVVANHPGLYDAVALASFLPRDDLRVISKPQTYWRLLPNLARQLVILGEHPAGSRGALREVKDHLSAGGAVLMFPSGEIEPDPAHFRGACESVGGWSRSPEWIASGLDELAILPAAVSGVQSREWLTHPLTRVRQRAGDRRWLAATLQFLLQSNRDVSLRVRFGEPIMNGQNHGPMDRDLLRQRVHNSIRRQLLSVSGPPLD